MKYLNLSGGTDFIFEPSLDCEVIRFPSGFETTVRLKNFYPKDRDEVTIVCRVESTADLFLIAQAKDALASYNFHDVSLILPFIPNGRQDRSMVKGDSFSLRVFADFLNSLNFKRIVTLDPHSIISNVLIRNLIAVPQDKFAVPVISTDRRPYKLIAPDAGSLKKVEEIGIYLGKEVVHCHKTRDAATGNIGKIEVYGNVDKSVCYICDDISDGGYTFILLTKRLLELGASEVNLVVSHGIFSKGLSPLLNAGISHIYTTNSFNHLQHLFGEDYEARKWLRVTDIRPLLKSYL